MCHDWLNVSGHSLLTFQVTETINGHYFCFLKSLFVVMLFLLVPLCSASAAYQASLAEPLFVFWRDVVEPKTLRHGKNMSLICSYVSTIKGTMRYLTQGDIFLVTVICQAFSYVKRTSLVFRPRELIRDRNIQHITKVNIEPQIFPPFQIITSFKSNHDTFIIQQIFYIQSN